MLDRATAAFLRDGYAATSIEAIARDAGVAKRTIYARWSGKPALFRAVLERLMTVWFAAAATGAWPEADGLEASLDAAARGILTVGLAPEAIALHRLLVAEGARFPELKAILDQAGAKEGMQRIAALLDHAVAVDQLASLDTKFAAEQFLHLVLAGPQRRALGLGDPLDAEGLDAWRIGAIRLFLSGLRSLRLPPRPD